MRLGEGWHDIVICNVSSRGLMARTRAAPPRGSFIEIRHGSICIVGQVRWSAGARFGIRAQERIDIMGLLVGRKSAGTTPSAQNAASARVPSRYRRKAAPKAAGALPGCSTGAWLFWWWRWSAWW